MAPLSNMNNMALKDKKIDWKHTRRALLCVGAGTGAGLIVYGIFLKLNIAIMGWNLGLIFAPLIAGYVETILANRLIGENIGAISAFILFIDTTFYSFILKNPTLGFNLITAGSIIVILQAAFPTLINYILLVVIGGILSNFIQRLRILVKKIENAYKNRPIGYWDGSNAPSKEEPDVIPYNEQKSNEELNSLDFYYLTSTNLLNIKHEIIGPVTSDIVLERDKKIIHIDPEKAEQQSLNHIKEGKDKCLINLAKKVKKNGGNGILDLTVYYNLTGLGGDSIQVTAYGIGINIEN